MKSRIPHSKNLQSQRPAQDHAGGETTSNVNHVREALISLGAPNISNDEFARLYRGRLATALLFVSRHVKGREEVAKAREIIQRQRVERNKSHIRLPDSIMQSPVDKASSALHSVNSTLEITRQHLEERLVAIATSQNEFDQLEEELRKKRRAKLMLDVLAKKESIRLKRFQELKKQLDELRKRISESHSQVIPSTVSHMLPVFVPRHSRISHTENIVANLHVYHIRISRVTNSVSASDIDLRFRNAIVHHQQAEMLEREQCYSMARSRARRKIQYRSELASKPVLSKVDLDKKLTVIKRKQKDVNDVICHSAALGFTAEHLIQSNSVFQVETSQLLKAALEDEAPLSTGYVDTLQRLIAVHPTVSSDHDAFMQSVGSALGVKGNVIAHAIIQEVERLIWFCHEREKSMLENYIPLPLKPTAEEEELITDYLEQSQKAQDRTAKLLNRKGEKADMGLTLAQDIKVLIQETKFVVG